MEGVQNIPRNADKGRMMKAKARNGHFKKYFQFHEGGFALNFLRVLFCFVFILILFSLFTFRLSLFSIQPTLPFLYAYEWKQAIEKRTWSFPKDHGSHPEYRTEWWYFTGNLKDETNKRYGYQLTFFRQGIEHPVTKDVKPTSNGNPWSVRDIYLGHFAVVDVEKKHFWYIDRTSRKGPGLAHADTKTMDVHILNWSARMDNNTIFLYARHKDMEINLELIPKKPVVLHGKNGLSKKGPANGQSSYYYSFTDIKTSGTLKTPSNINTIRVKGTSWFDHEFGSNQLTSEQVGWDWFSIHLSDGRDVMVYIIRRKDGMIEAASSGTLIEKNGSSRHLEMTDIKLDVLERWKSPKTIGLYPAKWRMKVPSSNIDITIYPSVANQELITASSTGVTYWEGAVEGQGLSNGKPVSIVGYVELTGYADSLEGLF